MMRNWELTEMLSRYGPDIEVCIEIRKSGQYIPRFHVEKGIAEQVGFTGYAKSTADNPNSEMILVITV
jgi:hypothetical protein